jgi:cytochrome oxidase assembly protein ShyY1
VTTPVWRRPIWLLGHVIAISAVLAFARLGVWQLDRLQEKQDRNRVIAERSDGPAVELTDVDWDRAEYQHVTATGAFAAEDDHLIPYRSYQGTVGSHAVTPLVLDDGIAVLVLRGWVPDEATPPPAGEVTVEGVLRRSGSARTSVDVEELEDSLDRDLAPLYLQQLAPDPPGDYPVVLDPPARDEGPHLSYAMQWFLFTGVVLVGYPILLRKRMSAASR